MIGLIPAAGAGTRWGGYIKELLPIGDRITMLDNCILTLSDLGCDQFVIVTTKDKIEVVSRSIDNTFIDPPVAYTIGGETMWESMKRGIYLCGDTDVVMMMPDTIVKVDNFSMKSIINFGLFTTDDPGRYSVLCEDNVFRKDPALEKKMYAAWGIVGWNGYMNATLLENDYKGFDEAFSAFDPSARSYGVINTYYDMANFSEYAKYIKENT